MISLLKGKIVKKSPDLLVIEAAGVGYGVIPTARAFAELPGEGEQAQISVHTHFSVNSREGSLELFGFSSSYEEEVFKKLLSISGIGPRAALKILSCVTAEMLAEAVVKGDLDKKKIPGLGPKRAATIMNELKGKISAPLHTAGEGGRGEDTETIFTMLKNYGFTAAEIRAAAEEIEEIVKSSGSMENSVKKALSVMRK